MRDICGGVCGAEWRIDADENSRRRETIRGNYAEFRNEYVVVLGVLCLRNMRGDRALRVQYQGIAHEADGRSFDGRGL